MFQMYLTPPLPQVSTALFSRKEEEARDLPPGAGGNIAGGRNTEIGKDPKDGYASAVRLTELCVCQELIHKQMLIL